MSKPVKIPDPTYEAAKAESGERDMSIGAVIESWRTQARVVPVEADDE